MTCFLEDFFNIYFGIMECFIEHLICFMKFLVLSLEDESHRIEKERYIEDRIEHRETLPLCRVWNQVSKSDRRRRDNGKIKCIKITPVLRSFKMMYENSTYKPVDHEKNSDNLKFMMWTKFMMRHRNLA